MTTVTKSFYPERERSTVNSQGKASRLLTNTIAVTIAATSIVVATPHPAAAMSLKAFAEAKSYPYAKRSGSSADPLANFWGGCSSYTDWRLLHTNGIKIYRPGPASEWKKYAIRHGYKVNHTPARGAVAWWEHGHVAWVKDVGKKDKRGHRDIVVRERNWPRGAGTRDREVNYPSIRGADPDYYIHFKDLK